MAVVHQSFATNSGTGTSITLTKPAGAAIGDVLIAFFGASGSLTGLTAPSGWTLAVSVGNSRAYYRIVDGTEGASFTWTLSISRTWGGGLSRYSGVDGTSPLDTGFPSTSTGTGTAASVGPITTTTANAMVIGGAFKDAAGSILPPGALTERWEVGASPVEHASAIQATAGSTGTQTWTLNTSGSWQTWLGALREANPAQTVSNPTFITSGEQVFSPTVVPNTAVSPPLIPTAEQVFTPTVVANQVVTVPLIPTGEAFFSPQVTVTGGPVSITVPLIASAEQVFAPSVTIFPSQPIRVTAKHDPQINVTAAHEPA